MSWNLESIQSFRSFLNGFSLLQYNHFRKRQFDSVMGVIPFKKTLMEVDTFKEEMYMF
jgi:hypothetical protein